MISEKSKTMLLELVGSKGRLASLPLAEQMSEQLKSCTQDEAWDLVALCTLAAVPGSMVIPNILAERTSKQ